MRHRGREGMAAGARGEEGWKYGRNIEQRGVQGGKEMTCACAVLSTL